jgi:hypothetical protein
MYTAKKNGKWGLIDASGKVLIDFLYEDAHHIAEGKMMVKKKGKYGFVDNNGKESVQCIYDDATCFHNGKAFVKEGKIWHSINMDGTKIKSSVDCKRVACAFLGLRLFETEQGTGVLNSKGEIIVPPIYFNAMIDQETGVINVFDKKGKSGTYTKNGFRLFDELHD